jgi:hypothetical protein
MIENYSSTCHLVLLLKLHSKMLVHFFLTNKIVVRFFILPKFLFLIALLNMQH